MNSFSHLFRKCLMRSLDEARSSLQITQDVIDFFIDGITRAGEPVAIVAYGSLARGEGREDSDYDILGLSKLTGRELKEYSLAADGELWGLDRDLDFLILNVEEFRASLKAGNEFACDVNRDGVILYGSFEVRGFMNERDLSNYQTILERCDDVIAKLECIGYSNEFWKRNRMVRDSILFSLGQVGELVSHFKTDEYKELFPEIPWRKIEKQCDYISCRYADMGYETAWKSAIDDVPAIRKVLLSNDEIARRYDTECAYISPELSEIMEGLGKDLDGLMDVKDGKTTY